MITNGFVAANSDALSVDTPLPAGKVAFYIYVTTTPGNIVWKNVQGELQYLPNAGAGVYHPLGAIEIVSSGLVNGVMRSTSAVGFAYVGGNIN